MAEPDFAIPGGSGPTALPPGRFFPGPRCPAPPHRAKPVARILLLNPSSVRRNPASPDLGGRSFMPPSLTPHNADPRTQPNVLHPSLLSMPRKSALLIAAASACAAVAMSQQLGPRTFRAALPPLAQSLPSPVYTHTPPEAKEWHLTLHTGAWDNATNELGRPGWSEAWGGKTRDGATVTPIVLPLATHYLLPSVDVLTDASVARSGASWNSHPWQPGMLEHAWLDPCDIWGKSLCVSLVARMPRACCCHCHSTAAAIVAAMTLPLSLPCSCQVATPIATSSGVNHDGPTSFVSNATLSIAPLRPAFAPTCAERANRCEIPSCAHSHTRAKHTGLIEACEQRQIWLQ